MHYEYRIQKGANEVTIIEYTVDDGVTLDSSVYVVDKYRYEMCVGVDALIGTFELVEDSGFMELLQELKEE